MSTQLLCVVVWMCWWCGAQDRREGISVERFKMIV